MKTATTLVLLAAFALGVAGCSTKPLTPDEKRRRAAVEARKDAEWEAEHQKQGEEDFQFYLEQYAHALGRAKSELTEAERAEARRDWERDFYHGWSHQWE